MNPPIHNTRHHAGAPSRQLRLLPTLLLLLIISGAPRDLIHTSFHNPDATTCYAANQNSPAQPEDPYEPFIVIKAAKVITCAGDDISPGMVVISNGKIHSVGQDLEYPLNAHVIDAHNRVVMPGLINPYSRYELDQYRRGGVHGDYTVKQTYHTPPATAYQPLLEAGYTTLALVPDGRGIPGRALVLRLAGPDDQRILKSPAYLRVATDKAAFRSALKKAKQEIEKVEKAREEWEKKQAEDRKKAEQQKKKEKQDQQNAEDKKNQNDQQPTTQPTTQPTSQPAFKPPKIDPAYQVLVDMLQEKSDTFALLELSNASDYIHFTEVLDKFKIPHKYHFAMFSSSDLEHVAADIGDEKAELLLKPLIHTVPYSAERLHIVRTLDNAGAKISLIPAQDSSRGHSEILTRLAELVRTGWPRDNALQAVTRQPADFLGLAERLGSIEKDKAADLIFLDADPLAPGARVREVMIAGEIVHRVEADD